MGQQAVADKTNEIGAIVDVLGALVLGNRVITMDAFYNSEHPHQALGYKTPEAVYRQLA